MNRRRFLKLFGAAAAAGAVPTVAGADAALAFADTHGSALDAAFQRLVDRCEDLRRPFVEFARQTDATAFSAAKLEEAMKQIAQASGVPLDMRPTTILTSPSRAAEIRELFSAKLEDRARSTWGEQLSTLVRHGDLEVEVRPLSVRDAMETRALFERSPHGIDLQVSPLVPPDALFLMPRDIWQPDRLLEPRPSYAPAFHELAKRS